MPTATRLFVYVEMIAALLWSTGPFSIHENVNGSWPSTAALLMTKPIGDVVSWICGPTTTGAGCHSAHPMEGGLAQGRPKISRPDATLVPAPMQGEPMPK